jgi:hypothetical protein
MLDSGDVALCDIDRSCDVRLLCVKATKLADSASYSLPIDDDGLSRDWLVPLLVREFLREQDVAGLQGEKTANSDLTTSQCHGERTR